MTDKDLQAQFNRQDRICNWLLWGVVIILVAFVALAVLVAAPIVAGWVVNG